MNRELYFAYGSNLNQERLHINCPSARLVSCAILHCHRLAFTSFSQRWHGAVADIPPDDEHQVWGAVWSISQQELAALDHQEGVEAEVYRRLRIKVELISSDAVRSLECWAYQVVRPDLSSLVPSQVYLNVLVSGAKSIGLPEHYVKWLQSHPTNSFSDDSEYKQALAHDIDGF